MTTNPKRKYWHGENWTETAILVAIWLIVIFIAVAIPSVCKADNCRQFFVQHKAVAAVVAAPVYAQPIYYQAGLNIEHDALAEKIARRVEARIVASLSAGQLVKQQQAAPPSALAQHCAKCHSGPTPEAGLTYDGTALECWQVTSALRQIAKRAMPKDHQLTPDVKGQIMQELLDLESRSPLPGELK